MMDSVNSSSSASSSTSSSASLGSLSSFIRNPHRRRKRRRPRSDVSSASSSTLPTISEHATSHRDHPRSHPSQHKGLAGLLLLALCVFNVVDVEYSSGPAGGGGRRSLLSTLYLSGPSTLLPWAQHHLVDVEERPDPDAETALFWHIPKSGGTTAKRLYQCMGRTLAHRVGADPRYGHDRESEVVVFEPHDGKDWKVVNVDTTIKAGINRAKKLGLVQSHTTDLIFTMEPQYAGQELYDENNRGRFLALFRHPVDRALSMYFYLQTATWERTYRPEWANMTVMEWATLPNAEEDYMVHKLVGKSFGDAVDETDLIIAKELVRQRFIVGLMGEMNESIRRFNVVLGVDEGSDRSQQCMTEFGLVDAPELEEEEGAEGEEGGRKLRDKQLRAADKKNSNKHPKFEEGSPEFEAVASRNKLDMLLYQYIESLFEAQKGIIDSYLLGVEEPEPGSEPTVESQDAPTAEVDAEPQAELAIPPPVPAVGSLQSRETTVSSNLVDISDPIQGRDVETPFFFHIPKSGGTTLQRLYWCMGATIANEVGTNPKFGIDHGEGDELVAFNPWKNNPGKVVNVDVSTWSGIREAKKRRFLTRAGQPRVDFVSTPEFHFASARLFSSAHKARMFALFRHPIEREVSKFFYLQKATWEPTYNARWARMSLEQWAGRSRGETNFMVRSLVGKSMKDELTADDLDAAKELVSAKFVVGLMARFEESVHRFNLLLGVDEGDPVNQKCIADFSTSKGDAHEDRNADAIVEKNNWNSYSHPKAEKGSDAWQSLAKIHSLDMQLYRHVVQQFAEQRKLFQPLPEATE